MISINLEIGLRDASLRASSQRLIIVVRMRLTVMQLVRVSRALYVANAKRTVDRPRLISCNSVEKKKNTSVDRPVSGILRKNRQYVSVITRCLSYLIAGNNNKNALFIAVE